MKILKLTRADNAQTTFINLERMVNMDRLPAMEPKENMPGFPERTAIHMASNEPRESSVVYSVIETPEEIIAML